MILKIITFNVAHGRGMDGKVDLQRQAEVIKEYKPDIVFFARSRYVHQKSRRYEPN